MQNLPVVSRQFHGISRFSRFLCAFFFSLILLAGCTGVSQSHKTSSLPPSTSETGEPAILPFAPDTLYDLLVAEVAASRNQTEVTLGNYLKQAHKTRDLGITRRATLIAQYLGANQAALDTALLWNILEPDNPEPVFIIATQLLKRGNLKEAFEYSLTLQEMHSKNLFQSIAAQAFKVPTGRQQALLTLYADALKAYPKNAGLLMGKSLLLHYTDQQDEALTYISRAIKADKNNLPAYQFKARLLEQGGQPQQAAKLLAPQIAAHPDNKRLQLQYARTLAEFNLERAQAQFQNMVNQSPFDADLILSLALVSKELNDHATAKEYLEQLLFLNKHTSSAYFYLAQINETDGDIDKAQELYRRVRGGDEYLFAMAAYCQLLLQQEHFAQCQAHFSHERQRLPVVAKKLFLIEADLLQRQGYFEASLDTMNKGLQQFPNDIELLYSRSMAHEQLGHLLLSEVDLRQILEIKPNDANTLNALGYVLANKTDRHHEAHELISRALKIEPDNPAFIDSMGWVLYRLDQRQEALTRLRQAMKLYPNHEVAAHLGEVLWVSGQQQEARQVFDDALKQNPDSVFIQEVIERLRIQRQ